MNGAQSLVRTLVGSGVEVVFTNPGTSEMHFVAALDDVPELRAVLALFEGVATGAADGYARMAGRPAAVLLHLGPGLGNGLANLHNARRAGTPVVTVVGDHATWHRGLDAPLESDITTVARNVSRWVRTSSASAEVGADAAEAVAVAAGAPGEVVTLVLPADVSWGDGGEVAEPQQPAAASPVPEQELAAVADLLDRDGPSCALLLGGAVTGDPAALDAAARVAAATGARLHTVVFPTRLVRGQGVAPIERLAYRGADARAQLDGVEHLVLVEADEPVTFFAYPEQPSRVAPEGCEVVALAGPGHDGAGALQRLAERLGVADDAAPRPAGEPPAAPTGALTAASLAAAVGALLPEGAVVVDEALTSGFAVPAATAAAPRHDLLTLTGGSIGFGLPLAVGAAVAAPDRPVLVLQADGSAMYTLQALWTMAREQLDVTVVLCNNSSYDILKMELAQVGALEGGERAQALFSLGDPSLDFVALAAGMGVPATRATTADELVDQLREALATPGPTLVEAVLPGVG